MFSVIPYPWDCMKYRVQHTSGIQLSTPTSSYSVELLVLSFCFVEFTMGKPRPIDRPPPVCPCILGCVAKEPSIHHLMMLLPLALRVNGSCLVPLRYLIICVNFSQSSLSGFVTRIVRKATAVQVSGLAHLVAYNVFATRL
jgi:hypothetical protein